MPTTRLGGTTGGKFGLAKIWAEPSPDIWESVADPNNDPIGFGLEVFAHRGMPDGTPIDREGLRYIAAVALESLRK